MIIKLKEQFGIDTISKVSTFWDTLLQYIELHYVDELVILDFEGLDVTVPVTQCLAFQKVLQKKNTIFKLYKETAYKDFLIQTILHMVDEWVEIEGDRYEKVIFGGEKAQEIQDDSDTESHADVPESEILEILSEALMNPKAFRVVSGDDNSSNAVIIVLDEVLTHIASYKGALCIDGLLAEGFKLSNRVVLDMRRITIQQNMQIVVARLLKFFIEKEGLELEFLMDDSVQEAIGRLLLNMNAVSRNVKETFGQLPIGTIGLLAEFKETKSSDELVEEKLCKDKKPQLHNNRVAVYMGIEHSNLAFAVINVEGFKLKAERTPETPVFTVQHKEVDMNDIGYHNRFKQGRYHFSLPIQTTTEGFREVVENGAAKVVLFPEYLKMVLMENKTQVEDYLPIGEELRFDDLQECIKLSTKVLLHKLSLEELVDGAGNK